MIHETVISIYSDKLAHVQVVINCPYSEGSMNPSLSTYLYLPKYLTLDSPVPYSDAHLCTSEATLAHNLDVLHFNGVMSYNSLTTPSKKVAKNIKASKVSDMNT